MSDFNHYAKYIFENKVIQRNADFSVQLCITHRCQNNCKHCYLSKTHNDMSHEAFLIILRQLKRYSMIKGIPVYLMFIGGDPLLHPEFEQFAQSTYETGIRYAIKGNPFDRKHKKMLKKLSGIGLDAYQLSVDGMKPFHDWLRGDASFDQTIQSFHWLKRLGIRATARLTLFQENAEDLLKLIPLLVKMRVSSLGLARSCHIGNFCNNNFAEFSASDYRDFLCDMVDVYKKYYQMSSIFEFKDHLWFPLLCELDILNKDDFSYDGEEMFCACSMFTHSIALSSDGNVIGCGKLPYITFGNIFSDSIENIMKAKEKHPSLNWQNYKKCSGCDYYKVCMGCPAVAKGHSGSELDPDPHCWH